eukprot:Rmarinus@m.4324
MSLSDRDLTPSLPAFLKTHLECAVCCHICTDWRVLPCQHYFCKECTDRLGLICASCRQCFTFESIKTFLSQNALSAQLPVFCDKVGRENGCLWEGTFESRAGHLQECGYQPVPCPRSGCTEGGRGGGRGEDGCKITPLRKNAEEHLRVCGYQPVACPCHSKGCEEQPLRKNLEAHVASCAYHLVPCPNASLGCPDKPLRKDVTAHVLSCGYQAIPCPYEGEGCVEQPLRKDCGSHAATCAYRLLTCCHEGCSNQFQAHHEANKLSHEDECEHRPVLCATCSCVVLQGQLGLHRDSLCPKATVACAAEGKKEISNMISGDISQDDVFAQVSCFAAMCVWEGTREAWTTHRLTCCPHQSSLSQTRLLMRLHTLDNSLQSLSTAHVTLVAKHEAVCKKYEELASQHKSYARKHEALTTAHEALTTAHEALTTAHEALTTAHEALTTA